VTPRLAEKIRERGLRGTLAAVGRRLRALVYRHERLIVLLKELDSIVEPRCNGGLRLEDLGSQHAAALAELNRKRSAADADARFAAYVEAGFHGFVAFQGDELVGYYWWVDRHAQNLFPDLRELGLGIELAERDAYGSDFFLLEEHRGGGTAGEFLFKLETSLRDRGYDRLWGYVISSNRGARWIYAVRQYRPTWIVHRRRWLFLRRTDISPV
jgi:GNAT superfamily N-acetyltransferase